jgi:hypothetical protein
MEDERVASWEVSELEAWNRRALDRARREMCDHPERLWSKFRKWVGADPVQLEARVGPRLKSSRSNAMPRHRV